MTNLSAGAYSVVFQPPTRLRSSSSPGSENPLGPLWEPTEKLGRRCHLWDFAVSLHCSIVGTCLTTGDLRKILIKLNTPDVAKLSEHEVHTIGVALAKTREPGGKLVQKALD